jgi:6-phosphogluconolactonase (cycloisomerase 2 family)
MTFLKKWMRLAMLGSITVAGASVPVHAASSYLAYVGTYTAASKGIYSFRFDPATGQLTAIGVAAELPNPAFLATDPQHRFLYAVTEMGPEPGADNYK